MGRSGHIATRLPAALCVSALLVLGASSCGGSGATAGSPSGADGVDGSATHLALPVIEITKDDDDDSDKRPHEADNESEVFGHPADATDTRLVTELIKRYYTAAAHENGASACRLLYSVFAEAIPETYGSSTGPPGLRGDSCAVVMTKLFKQQHRQLSGGATVKVATVRVDMNRAVALFGFDGRRATHYRLAHRERGAWKLEMLLDVERPVGVE
jgi:hypothetical protein